MEPIIEAVSAVLLCRNKVFVIQRQFHLRAFPGYLAFPGGKIDEADSEGSGISEWSFPHQQQVALQRELREELNWDLFEHWRQGNVLSIDKMGTALTPPGAQLRFSNHVFRIELASPSQFRTDPGEVAWSSWQAPLDLLQRYHAGTVHVAPPTRLAVEALARDMSTTRLDYSRLKPSADRLGRYEFTHGVSILPVPSNTLPPATCTNALYFGDDKARKILVDPSPKDSNTLKALIATLKPLQLDAVLISHHHADHHERLPELVAQLGLPVIMTAKTRDNLRQRMGDYYLQQITLDLIAEGDAVTEWKGHPVRAYELPGHDNGMIGLAPDNLAWMFVADLVEPGTTVVIPEDVGDMRLYLDSLQRVIDLAPDAIIPSHGSVQVGLHLLHQTLQHRYERERQILALWHAGSHSEEAMYPSLYPGLSDRLRPLALQNIRMHLRKLIVEQVIDDTPVT